MDTGDEPLLSAHWTRPDAQTAAERHAFLELVAAALAQPRAASVAELRPTPGQTVLDAGCGTGIAAVELAHLLRPGGRVLAVDADPDMVAATAHRAAGGPVEASVGDILALDLPDDAVDAARVERVLLHLTPSQADAAVAELVRVTRPGGRVAALEPEMLQLSVDAGDAARRLLQAASDRIANPRAGVRIRAALLDAGCVEVTVAVHPIVVTDLATFLRLNPLRERADQLLDAGLVIGADVEEAFADLGSRDAAGRFLSVHLLYVVAGTVGPQ